MQEEYNWNIVLAVAGPASIIEAYIFYTDISNGWKWISLIIAISAVFGIIYLKDKKKHNIFTAVGIVFLAALVVKLFKDFGLF